MCVSPVFAQDTLTVAADTLVVSALRADRPFLEVPFAMDVRAITDLPRAEPGMSLGEKLRYVPGLVVDNRQNMSQGDRITMRGIGARAAFGVRGIRLVLDGIPLTMPDGQAQLSNLDLVDIARVEVLRGPSAALYGNASGGVILLQSGAGKQGTFSIRPSVVMGGNGLRRVQVQTSGQTGNHTYAASGYQMVATGYRDFSSGRTWALNAHNTYRISDRWQVSGAIHHVDSPFLLNPSSLDRATADSLPKTARFFVRSQGSSKSVLQTQGGVTARFSGQGVRVETTLYGLRRALYTPFPAAWWTSIVRPEGGDPRFHGIAHRSPGRRALMWRPSATVAKSLQMRACPRARRLRPLRFWVAFAGDHPCWTRKSL
jgi:iron complex outermembrane recepter protein